MLPYKRDKLLLFSIVLSLISIAITVFINIKIAQEYLRVDGKTRALFGIKELYEYGYQYYIALMGIVSLVLAILSLRRHALQGQKYMAIFLSAISMIIVFVRIWRLFV